MEQTPAPTPLPPDASTADLLFKALRLEGFFPELTPEHVEKLFPRSGLFEYPLGARLCREGDDAGELFIVCAGEVEITRKGAAAPLARLTAGEIVGEIAYLQVGRRRSATATASKPSRVYRLSYLDIDYTFRNNPPLAEHMQSLADVRRPR